MKRLLHASASLLLLSASLLASPAAHAQISNDLIMSNYNATIGAVTSSAIDNASLNNVLEDNARSSSRRSKVAGRTGAKAGRGSNAGMPRATSANSAALSYNVTPALKEKTLQRYVKQLQTSSPTTAQSVATYFGPGKHDYNTVYQDVVSGYGLRANNPADALAAYLTLGWMIVNNVDDKAVTPAMVQGARAQFGPVLASNPQMTPAVAAQAGEDMKLQLAIVHVGWQGAIKGQNLPAFRQGVATLFKKQYAMDLTAFKLNNNGFTRK
ncbi:hypothetical protein [Hymenobacter negativus]|uniref:Uncharacterized protein n=1 Tax=Hymenobacter negativus TaxID=2795026 RepID=A0ABS3QMX6_9BACT|nr:hypothetical protein [Hymenobacter negativus]MBO2012293.1 hypothetical protein [Hymenobacter negativus]